MKKIPAEIAFTIVNDYQITDTASFIVQVTDDQKNLLAELLANDVQKKKIKTRFRARTGIPWPNENAFSTILSEIKKPL